MRYDVDVSLSSDTCACAIVVRTSFFCWSIPGNPQPCPEADMIRRDYLSTHSWHACSQLRLKRSVRTATDDHWGKLFGLWHACILATLSIARRSCKRTEFGLRSAVYVVIHSLHPVLRMSCRCISNVFPHTQVIATVRLQQSTCIRWCDWASHAQLFCEGLTPSFRSHT